MFARLRSFWRSAAKRREMEGDLDDEMRFHVEARTEQLMRERALPRAEAERQARIEFGGTENYQEECRESRGVRWIDDLRQDLRYGARSLRKSPGLMIVAVVTLAIGVGCSSLLFSMVQQWVLQSVTFPQAERLAVLWKIDSKKGWTSAVSSQDFEDWREQNQVFERLSAWVPDEFNVSGGERPERIHGARVSANFFRTLGVVPVAGRDFAEGDDRAGAGRVAIISSGLWHERFQSTLTDQTIQLNGEAYTIAGVLPEDFHFTLMGRANIWVPLVFTDKERADRSDGWLSVIGRRKADLAAAGVTTGMNTLARNLEQEYPETNTNSAVLVRSLSDEIGRHVGNQALYTGVVVAICILLIGCSNLAGIFLARTLTRRREMSVRLALGAGRWRLARQMIAENALLLPLAVGAGLWMVRLSENWISTAIPFENRGYLPNYGRMYMDGALVAYAVGVALISVLLFSISPVLEGFRLNLSGALKESGGGSSTGARSQRMRQALVICQIVLATVVIVPGGLTAKELVLLLRDSPGFRPDHLLTAEIGLPVFKYAEPARQRAFYDQLLEKLRATPQVEGAAASEFIPFGHRMDWEPFWVAGQPEPAPGEVPGTLMTIVTPTYASTLGITLLRGRFVSESDGPGTLPVVVVSQTLAQRYLPNEDALGHKLRIRRDDPTWYTIVGIVRDTKIYNLSDAPMAQSYLADAQSPRAAMSLVIRTTGNPAELTAIVQSAVWSLDKELPLSGVEPMQQRIDDEQAPLRIFTWFSGVFSVVALFLAGIGIYGVMAYLVESRAREIGIRVACGASRRNIFRLVLSGAMRLVAIGLALGLLGAFGVARLLMSALELVRGRALDVYAIAVVVLCAAVLGAIYVPMRRATRVDPLLVLRSE
jgi:putative ABC transport system permease protein